MRWRAASHDIVAQLCTLTLSRPSNARSPARLGRPPCALDVQRIIRVRNAELPQDRRIEFRIGVNVGDVIVAPDDIYGHGVNVAARLEGLAPPGGICISADAWGHVRGAVAGEFVDLGERRLKNIADPAHVFAFAPAA